MNQHKLSRKPEIQPAGMLRLQGGGTGSTLGRKWNSKPEGKEHFSTDPSHHTYCAALHILGGKNNFCTWKCSCCSSLNFVLWCWHMYILKTTPFLHEQWGKMNDLNMNQHCHLVTGKPPRSWHLKSIRTTFLSQMLERDVSKTYFGDLKWNCSSFISSFLPPLSSIFHYKMQLQLLRTTEFDFLLIPHYRQTVNTRTLSCGSYKHKVNALKRNCSD